MVWSCIFFCTVSGLVSSSRSGKRALVLLCLPVLCFKPFPHLNYQGDLSHPTRPEWEGRKGKSRKILTWWVVLLSWLCAPQIWHVFKVDCMFGGWLYVFVFVFQRSVTWSSFDRVKAGGLVLSIKPLKNFLFLLVFLWGAHQDKTKTTPYFVCVCVCVA